MITAKEALELCNEYHRDRISDIGNLIKDSAKDGIYAIVLDYSIKQEEKDKLVSCGYTVEPLKLGVGTEIRWQFAK